MRRSSLRLRLGLTGSRHWTDERLLRAVLDAVRDDIAVLVHGGALAGADEMAQRWAYDRHVEYARIAPRADDIQTYGMKRALIERNSVIVAESDRIIAFRAIGNSPGTDDTITKAIVANKLWLLISDRWPKEG